MHAETDEATILEVVLHRQDVHKICEGACVDSNDDCARLV